MDLFEHHKLSLRFGLFSAVIADGLVSVTYILSQRNIDYLPLWLLITSLVFGVLGWFSGEILLGFVKKDLENKGNSTAGPDQAGKGQKFDTILPSQSPDE